MEAQPTDITKISDLELSKILGQQYELFMTTRENIRALQAEIARREEASKSKQKS